MLDEFALDQVVDVEGSLLLCERVDVDGEEGSERIERLLSNNLQWKVLARVVAREVGFPVQREHDCCVFLSVKDIQYV